MSPDKIRAQFDTLREKLPATLGEPPTSDHMVVVMTGLVLLEGFLVNVAKIAERTGSGE